MILPIPTMAFLQPNSCFFGLQVYSPIHHPVPTHFTCAEPISQKSDIMKLKVSQCHTTSLGKKGLICFLLHCHLQKVGGSKVSVHDWALHTKFYYVMLPNQDRDLQ